MAINKDFIDGLEGNVATLEPKDYIVPPPKAKKTGGINHAFIDSLEASEHPEAIENKAKMVAMPEPEDYNLSVPADPSAPPAGFVPEIKEPERLVSIGTFPIKQKAPWLMRMMTGGEEEAQAVMKANLFRQDPERAKKLYPDDDTIKYLADSPEQSFIPSMWNMKLDGQRIEEVEKLAGMTREERKKLNETKGKIKTGEHFGKKKDPREFMLFSGVLKFLKSSEFKGAVDRLQKDDYAFTAEGYSPNKASDQLIVRDKLLLLEEMQDRGMTLPATVLDSIANMAKYAGEIYLMAGMIGGGIPATQLGKAGLAGKMAAMNVGELAALTSERMTIKGRIGDKGEFIKTEEGQSLLKALPKSFLQQTVTYWTEQQGEAIGRHIRGVGSKILKRLPKGLASVIAKSGKLTKPFYDMLRKGKLDGMLPELAEEYIERVIVPALMLDDQYRDKSKTYLKRVAESFIPDKRELLVQTLTFSVMPIAGHITGVTGLLKEKEGEPPVEPAPTVPAKPSDIVSKPITPAEPAKVAPKVAEGIQQAQINAQIEAAKGKTELFKNKKGDILIAEETDFGLSRVVIDKQGNIEPIGSGPVDTKIWKPAEPAKVAKEPWEMTAAGKEWAELSIDEVDRVAFGFARGDIKILKPSELKVKYKTDYENAVSAQEKSGLNKRDWAKKVDLSEPIDVVYENGKFQIEDGYNRYYAAKILNKQLNVDLTIKDKPHIKIVQQALSEGKPVPRTVLEEYKSEKWAQEALKGVTEYDSQKEERLVRGEPQGEEPGRPVQVEEKGEGEIGPSGVFQGEGGVEIPPGLEPLAEKAHKFKTAKMFTKKTELTKDEVTTLKAAGFVKKEARGELPDLRAFWQTAHSAADSFEKQIQALSDSELSKSLNKMIKVRSEISDSLVDQWRKEDTDRKITFMQAEWERRGKKSKEEQLAEAAKFTEEAKLDEMMTKAEMGEIPIEGEYQSQSAAFNEHLDYFQNRQLPKKSKIRSIQAKMRTINGKRLAGTLTAQKANKFIRQLRKELFETARKEGIALRMTRGGKLSLAVRKAGTYVPEEFAQYGKFKDVYPLGKDMTRSIQEIDGSLPRKEKVRIKGQAGALEQNVLWPIRDISIQKIKYLKEKRVELKSILKARRGSKEDKQINLVLEQIAKEDRDIPIKELLNRKTLRAIADPATIRQAVGLRKFYDDLIEEQNLAREMRDQDPIPYRRNYSPHILRDATIWERLMMTGKKPTDVTKADLPDYIKPNEPFNPREMAREAGILYEKRVLSATELARSYLATAAKDIFNTSIIQNNKAFIQQLEAMGYKKASNYLGDLTAEAYAGIAPAFDRGIKLTHLPKTQKKMRWFNQVRNMAVFPLNFAWNLTTQPSSMAFTIGRHGGVNTLRGFMQWISNPEIRREMSENYYSYIVKSSQQGRITRQDAQNLIGQEVRVYRTPKEFIQDVGGFVTHQIEKMLTGISIRAAYLTGKKKGLTGQALINYASDEGGKSQSMYNDEDKPAFLRSLAMKTTLPYQTFNYEVVNAFKEWVGRTGTPPSTQLERMIIMGRFLAAVTVFALIAKRLANKEIWSWKRPPIPFAEFWLTPIMRIFNNEYIGTSGSGLTSPVETSQRMAKGLNDFLETGATRKLRNEVLKYGPSMLWPIPIPGGIQISRTVDAIIAYSQGGVRDRKGRLMFKMEDPQDLVQAIFSGVWSTEGGRGYLDPEYKWQRMTEQELDLELQDNTYGKRYKRKDGKWYPKGHAHSDREGMVAKLKTLYKEKTGKDWKRTKKQSKAKEKANK